jgi:hypothetical protein
MITESDVVQGTSQWVQWWVDQRQSKLRQHMSHTMSMNPFLMPVLFEFHSVQTLHELFEITIASHLVHGHSTGFGKLIDEKILPNVFKTEKLDARFRLTNIPYHDSCFDEIDHLIHRTDGKTDLLSLKASRWTIQLTMAVQLNAAFNEILSRYPDDFNSIVVGVFYGTEQELTDKYRILRGINTGKNHNVFDLRTRVFVNAGVDFWSWLNDGERKTQDWVLKGILKGVKESRCREITKALLVDFEKVLRKEYDQYTRADTPDVNWQSLLHRINGSP